MRDFRSLQPLAEKPASRDIVGVRFWRSGLEAPTCRSMTLPPGGQPEGRMSSFTLHPSDPAARDTIMSDSNIRKVVDQLATPWWARQLAPALLDEGGFSAEDLDNLRQAGVVGDMCMSFFNIKGEHVSTQLEARMIGVSLAQLRSVECVVAIAGGVNKASAILGALRTGVVDALVTDDVAARKVLEMDGKPEV